MPETPQRLSQIVLSVAGLVVAGGLFYPNLDQFFSRQNDFMPLYVAATLVQTGDLYNPARYEAFELEHFGFRTQIHYNRLPFYAKLLQPLAKLEYWPAYWIFSVVRLAALAGFLALWTLPSRSATMLYTCCSFPLFASLFGGQDVVIPLLGMALAVRLYQSGRGFAAGLAMTLFAVKFHLFVLTPLALLRDSRRSVLYGFASGVIVLLIANTWISGWDWPLQFLNAAISDTHDVQVETMPNLHGLLTGLPAALWLEAAAGLVVIGLTWLAVRRSEFAAALAVCTWGGLLISHHAYVGDTLVLLPAALALTASYDNDWSRFANLVILTPPLSLALMLSRPASIAMQMMILVYFIATCASAAPNDSPLNRPAGQTAI